MNGKLAKRLRVGSRTAILSDGLSNKEVRDYYRILKKYYKSLPYHRRRCNSIYAPLIGHSEQLKQWHLLHVDRN